MKFRLRRLFDEKFYREKYPDLRESGIDPIQHFCEVGHREDRNPHPIFDTHFYRANFMVPGRTENPLLHYLRQERTQANTHPLFDAGFYSKQVFDGDLNRLPNNVSLLEHFLTEHCLTEQDLPSASPSPVFDAQQYLDANPQIRSAGINGLYHFLRFGMAEGRQHFFDNANLQRLRYLPDSLLTPLVSLLGQHVRFAIDVMRRNQRLDCVLFVANAADQTPESMRAFEIARRIQQRFKVNVVTLLTKYGRLRESYLELGPVFCLHGASREKSLAAFENSFSHFKTLMSHADPSLILVNDFVAADVLDELHEFSVPMTALNHKLVSEFPTGQFSKLAEASDRIVFPSRFAWQRALENTPLNTSQLEVVTPGLPDSHMNSSQPSVLAQRKFVVGGMGEFSHESGFDLFVSIALTALNSKESNLRFVWTGPKCDGSNSLLRVARQDVQRAKQLDNLTFNEIAEELAPHTRECDVFLMTSRGTGFSSELLAAMAGGLPVMLFHDCSGHARSVAGVGGAVIPFADVNGAVKQIQRFASNRGLVQKIGNRNRKLIESEFDFGEYTQSLLEVADSSGRFRFTISDKRRVIFCSPSWEVSGVNTFTELLVRQLNGRGFDASILFTTKEPARQNDVQQPGVPFQYLSNLTLDEPKRRQRVLEFMRVQGECVFVPNFDYVASSIANQLPSRVRTVGILHSDEDEHYLHAYRMGNSWDRIVTVSERIQSRLKALSPSFADRTQLIRYGIGIESLDQKAISELRNTETLRIIYTGRIQQQQKRIFDFVALAEMLHDRQVPFEMTLIGDGDDLSELRNQMLPFIDRKQVCLPGRMTPGEIRQRLMQSHAFCLVSEFEGLPLSMLEAMAVECVPVVHEIESGISEILTHGENALLSPKQDTAAMADNLVELYENVVLRKNLGRRARMALFRYRLSVEQMADSYAKLFEELHREIGTGGRTVIPMPINCPAVDQMLNAA